MKENTGAFSLAHLATTMTWLVMAKLDPYRSQTNLVMEEVNKLQVPKELLPGYG